MCKWMVGITHRIGNKKGMGESNDLPIFFANRPIEQYTKNH